MLYGALRCQRVCSWLAGRLARVRAPTPARAPICVACCAGKAASTGVTTAAKVTVQVGAEALKAAAPVGKWALQQGVKLAVGAVAKGISSAVGSGDGKKDGGSGKGKKK